MEPFSKASRQLSTHLVGVRVRVRVRVRARFSVAAVVHAPGWG